MAAQEYYLGTQGAQELQGSNYHPNVYPAPTKPSQYQQPPAQPYPQPQSNAPSYANTPPPLYSAYAQPQPPRPQGYNSQQHFPEKTSQAMIAPYPQTPPPQQQQQHNGYLGAPLQPIRSHSQPARVRFAEQDSDRSTSLGSISDSEDSPPHHRHHHQHHHWSHNRPQDTDHNRDSDYSDHDRERRRHRHKKSSYDRALEKEHKSRDTFLGAGAGTLIGDAIFPGLGTAAGLVLGGYGGRKYAERSKSEDPRHHYREYSRRRGDSYSGSDCAEGKGRSRRRKHGGSRRAGDDGWDEETATFRKGAAVR